MIIQSTAIILLALATLSVAAVAKTGSSLYPPEKVANARRNIERYEWARQVRDVTVVEARKFTDLPDDFLWELVTPQDIPRGTQVNKIKGCPKCGKAIEKFGIYPWKCNVIEKPWKIECPSCHEIFPKNDFAKFYESGKDEKGIFRYEKADRSLLFNSEHPDPKDPLYTYGVDDTLGWKDESGIVYRFVGYYGHYGSWAAVMRAVDRLKDAYIYTGDPVYARKAGILLYRAAQFYPDMNWNKWDKLGFSNSDGGSGKGKVYGKIWEMNIANTMLMGYDGVCSGLDDPVLIEYLSKKTGLKVDVESVRNIIEKNIIREAYDSILKGNIAGNEGMHQSTMAYAAVVLDEPGTTEAWLDWIFADGDLNRGDSRGGNIKRLLNTKIDEDGMGNEASPMYNGLWRRTFKNIQDVLDNYPKYQKNSLTRFPKYKKMFETPVKLICLDRFIPNIGDCNKTGEPDLGGISVSELVYAFKTFNDPPFARMAYYLNGNKADGIRGSIFDSEPESAAREIEAAVKEHGPYVLKTEELPAYGLAVLRSGKGKDQRALSLYYGRNSGHGHKDTLNIELFGLGLNLMPDIGYPEHASAWPSRQEWTSNTISHNTVVVDRAKQQESLSGTPRFVKEGRGVSAVEVYADKVYPETSLYQRTSALVDVSDESFYVIDIFRVKGGKEHHYSLHGPEGEVTTEGLNLVEQKSGTLAGENIAFGADMGGRESLWISRVSGFQYLYDVRRDNNPSKFATVEWKVKDTWDVLKDKKDIRLRMTLVDPPGDVVLAHGDPPQNRQGNPRRLTYLIADNKAEESTFVSVIEPYVRSSAIEKIERTDQDDTVTLKITLKNGRTDYIFSSLDFEPVKMDGIDFFGKFGVFTTQSSKTEERLVVK